jgi:very-short-patch-repair endonuclease
MRAPSKTVDRARRLRRAMTLPEAILWRELRRRTLAGFRFRRQHPVGPYVLDFYCPEARLALEVDGAAHDNPTRAAQDEHRTAWLAERGIRVLRLPARNVLRGDDAEHVLPTIAAVCAELTEGSSLASRGRWQPQSG